MKNLNYLQPGLYPGLTFSEYRAYGRFGGSDAAYLATHSPAHWREYRKQPGTPAQKFGTAAHVLILEGTEAFEQRYIVHPGFDRRTNAGKAAHLEFVTAHAEYEILTQLEYNTLMEMNLSVRQSMIASDILESCAQREVSLFWHCQLSDVQCCGRLDFVGDGIVGDLKTTSDASPEAFQRSVLRYGYYIQAGHYIDGLAVFELLPRFMFIAVEKDPPYAVGVYELDEDLLVDGIRQARIARRRYQEAEAEGYWANHDGIVMLTKNGVNPTGIIDL